MATPFKPSDYELHANGISIVFARRLAGAVWTMKWKNRDFVEVTEGNGASQQSAIAYDIPPGESSELDNPTEAGNRMDSGGKTTSRWIHAARGTLTTGAFKAPYVVTKTSMAYYRIPGEALPPSNTRARGKALVSDTTLIKMVQIGYKGMPNVIKYSLVFHTPSTHWFAQAEVLTGYMPAGFRTIYTLENGRLRRQPGPIYRPSNDPKQPRFPVVIAKDNGTALGVMFGSHPPLGTFGRPWYTVDTKNHAGRLPNSQRVVQTTKWNVVWQTGSQFSTVFPAFQKVMPFSVFLVLGSVEECLAGLIRLQGMGAT